MGELLAEIYRTLVDNKIAVDVAKAVKADAEANAKAKATVDAERAALDQALEKDRLEYATKAAALAKLELEERTAQVEEHNRRLRAEEQAIAQDRARRGKRVLSPTELRVRATRSINQQDMAKGARR